MRVTEGKGKIRVPDLLFKFNGAPVYNLTIDELRFLCGELRQLVALIERELWRRQR
jgi:hypothetical protein